MKPSQCMDIINEVEERFPVDQWLMDGVHVWPLIRIPLAKDIQNTTQPNDVDHSSSVFRKLKVSANLLNAFVRYSHALISDYRKNDKVVQGIEAIFLTNTINRILIDNAFYNRLVDPLSECLNSYRFRTLVLENESRGQYHIPRYKPSKFIRPYLDCCLVKNRAPLKRKPCIDFQLDCFDDFTGYLRALNLRLTVPSIEYIQDRLLLLRDFASFFKKTIMATNSILGFCTAYYGMHGMAFNLACRERSVPSVDIQHGIQSDLHWAYGRWLKVPEKGYELLPTIFWCWSKDEANVIEKWNKRVRNFHKPIIGGNLWLRKWLDDKDPIVYAYDTRISNVKRKKGKSINILYTLQTEMIPEWVLQSIKRSSAKCFWWIRVHPREIGQRAKIKNLLNNQNIENVELDRASDWPLYALLRNVDIHVTGWSTSVIEATTFGVPSILIHGFGADLFAEQINSGLASYACNMRMLLQTINYQFNSTSKSKLKRKSFTSPICKGIQLLLDEVKGREGWETNRLRSYSQ